MKEDDEENGDDADKVYWASEFAIIILGNRFKELYLRSDPRAFESIDHGLIYSLTIYKKNWLRS
jgi:hypothetical protein